MKRLLKSLSLATAGLLVLAVGLPLLFEDAISERALAAVRGQLRTDVQVADVSLSLLRDFPYASVALEDVTLAGYPTGQLLRAERLSGRISYYDLLFAEGWSISTVSLHTGALHVERNAQKIGNWQVFQPAKDSAAAAGVSFAIQRIVLDNIDLTYVDVVTATDITIDKLSGQLSGDFGTQNYVLKGQLAGHSQQVGLGSKRYLEDLAVSTDIELDIALADNAYRFGPSTVTLEDMPIRVSGSIAYVKASTAYNLRLATGQGQLGVLLRALPREWVTPEIRALESSGAFALTGTIEGLYDKRHSPALQFSGELDHGTLRLPALDQRAEDVSFTLDYTNGEGHSMADSRLQLQHLTARLDGQPLTGDFLWRNFNDPYYDITGTGTLPLSWFGSALEDTELRGTMTLTDLHVAGRQRHLADTRHLGKVKIGGALRLDDVALAHRGETLTLDAPLLSIQRNVIDVENAVLGGLDNEVKLDLTLIDLLPYLFGNQTQQLRAEGTLYSDRLNLDRWVELFNTPQGATAKGVASTAADRQLVPGFAGRLIMDVAEVRYEDILARDFMGSCVLKQSQLAVSGEALAMEGHWEVDGTLDLLASPRLSAKLGCSEVNVTELFEQSGNLGQDVVEARNLEGQMTTRAYVEAHWDTDGTLLDDGLHVWANVGLTDGELRDFEMLQALSRFVRSEDLEHIHFTDVEHWVEVTNDRVYLPAMFIQSSATNFTVAGEHSFAQDVDYAIRVNGAQVLLTKLFGKREGMTYLPDRRSGWARTGFRIEGTLVDDDYSVRMSGSDVKAYLGRSLSRKAAIRNKLGRLFGFESLIDDYDDDGVRRLDRPATRSLRSDFAEASTPRKRPQTNNSSTSAALTVDTDSYLEWDDEEQEQALDPQDESRPSSEAAVTRTRDQATRTAATRRPPETKRLRGKTKASKKLTDGLFKTAPGEFSDDEDEDEYLEGFDVPDPDRQ